MCHNSGEVFSVRSPTLLHVYWYMMLSWTLVHSDWIDSFPNCLQKIIIQLWSDGNSNFPRFCLLLHKLCIINHTYIIKSLYNNAIS